MLIKPIFTFFSHLSLPLPTQTPMQRLPLTPLNILNHTNPTFESLPLQHKLSKKPNSSFEKNRLAKTENSREADLFDNSISFHDLQPAAEEESSRKEDNFLDCRTQSSSTKSSLQKKTIKKTHTESEKKLKARFRQREMRATKGAKAAEISRSSPLHITYNFTPKKFLSQLMSQEEEEIPEMNESIFASTSTRNETDSKKAVEKNVYCVNLLPNDAKMAISGINVFIGDEYDEALNFPTETKTIKYVV